MPLEQVIEEEEAIINTLAKDVEVDNNGGWWGKGRGQS